MMNGDEMEARRDEMTAPAGGAGQSVPVPVSALAIDGAEPAPGDEVEFTVSGTVNSVNGSMAIVQPTAINGQPLPAAEAEPDEEALRNSLGQEALEF